MLVMINIKLDPRMKAAIQKIAEKQFISMSAAIKQAIEKYLKEHGVDWRKESAGKKAKK
jgi:predicted transcriptional regulator